MKTRTGLFGVMGLAALLTGIAAAQPAIAQGRGDYGGYDRQEQGRYDHEGRPIRSENFDTRSDERRLHDLEDRRDREARRHDWNDVRALDRQIRALREHIERARHARRDDRRGDRRDQHRDRRDNRRDQREDYRDDYRSHDDGGRQDNRR